MGKLITGTGIIFGVIFLVIGILLSIGGVMSSIMGGPGVREIFSIGISLFIVGLFLTIISSIEYALVPRKFKTPKSHFKESVPPEFR